MSLTRPLTRPLTRALSQSELTQKFGGGFSIFALNPYLLFDARDSMVGTLENPTLDLNPALPETLDVITATRAGTATFTDANGLIASAPANTVRVDQTQGAELTPTKFQRFINTEFDQAFWTFNSKMTAVYNYDTAPNGEQDATRLVSIGGAYPQVLETVSSLTIGQQYTASFYVKSDGTSQIQQFTHFTGLSGGISFTPTDSWERISFTITATATSHIFVVFTNNGSAPASSFLIWGPQLEEGTTASDFVANTTGSPKFITGATFGPRVPMILVEPSATNLLPYSEDFSNAAWTKFGGGTGIAPVVTPDFGTSPDGTVSASRVQFNKGTGTTVGDQSTMFDSAATSSGATTSKSVYLKSNTNEAYEMVIYEVTSASGTNVKKITVTPDWQRFDVYGAVSSTTTGLSIGLRELNVSGLSNTADVLVWGAQVETGSVATSYIPTSGSTVTRAADDLVISGSDFTNFFNSGGDGTFFVTAQIKTPEEQHATLRGGSNSQLYLYTDFSAQHFAYDGGSSGNSYGSVTANQLTNFAVSYNSSTFTVSKDGSSDSSLSTTGNLSNATRLEIGTGYSTGFCGHFRRIIYWPYSSDSL